jgi:hypothetical protein
MTDVYRPRSAGEIVDAAVQLFRRDARTFLAIGAIVEIPMLLLRTALMSVFGVTPDGAPDNLLAATSLTLLEGLLLLLVTAALAVAADRAYMGAHPGVRASFAEAGSKFGAFFVATFLSTLLFGLGVLLLVVGAFYFFARYTLSPTVALLEAREGTNAMSRASKLSEGRKLHVLASVGAAWLIFFAVVFGMGALSAIVPTASAFMILGPLVNVFVLPLIPIALVITYYDLRIRAEGYDIELLERQATSSAGPETRAATG